MKKRLTLIIALTLIFVLALSACGSKKADEETNIVNFPVIDVGGEVEEEAVAETESETPVDQTYPIEQIQEVAEVMLAYPIDPNSADYDEQMEEYLTQLFGDKHKLESLLEKDFTAEELYEILTNADHMHLNLGPEAIQVIINWFMSR